MVRNLIAFITHATLDEYHADLCFRALSNSHNPIPIDELIIYNSHADELPNLKLLGIISRYDLHFIKKITIFPYDNDTHKSLGGDVLALSRFFIREYPPTARVLFLKSEMLVSVNLLDELRKTFDMEKVLFTPPLLNAKKSITDDELIDRSRLKYMIFSSEDTFFMEDEKGSIENDFRDRLGDNRGANPGNPAVKYLSCSGKKDWSLHYISINLLQGLEFKLQAWGGMSFARLQEWWIGAYKSFTVHKWHPIASKNCSEERPGDYNDWLNG